jgi:hypothetical protein
MEWVKLTCEEENGPGDLLDLSFEHMAGLTSINLSSLNPSM